MLSTTQATSAKSENNAAIRGIQLKTDFIIEQLANELDEPEVKQAFLASPLVMEIRMGQ